MVVLNYLSCFLYNILFILLHKLSYLRCVIPTNSTSSSFAISLITNLYCLKVPRADCKMSVLIVL